MHITSNQLVNWPHIWFIYLQFKLLNKLQNKKHKSFSIYKRNYHRQFLHIPNLDFQHMLFFFILSFSPLISSEKSITINQWQFSTSVGCKYTNKDIHHLKPSPTPKEKNTTITCDKYYNVVFGLFFCFLVFLFYRSTFFKQTNKKEPLKKKKTNKICFFLSVVFYHDLKHRGDNLFTLFFVVLLRKMNINAKLGAMKRYGLVLLVIVLSLW